MHILGKPSIPTCKYERLFRKSAKILKKLLHHFSILMMCYFEMYFCVSMLEKIGKWYRSEKRKETFEDLAY